MSTIPPTTAIFRMFILQKQGFIRQQGFLRFRRFAAAAVPTNSLANRQADGS
jgi:hypothetical protein